MKEAKPLPEDDAMEDGEGEEDPAAHGPIVQNSELCFNARSSYFAVPQTRFP